MTRAFIGDIARVLLIELLGTAESPIVALFYEPAFLRIFRLRRRLLHVI